MQAKYLYSAGSTGAEEVEELPPIVAVPVLVAVLFTPNPNPVPAPIVVAVVGTDADAAGNVADAAVVVVESVELFDFATVAELAPVDAVGAVVSAEAPKPNPVEVEVEFEALLELLVVVVPTVSVDAGTPNPAKLTEFADEGALVSEVVFPGTAEVEALALLSAVVEEEKEKEKLGVVVDPVETAVGAVDAVEFENPTFPKLKPPFAVAGAGDGAEVVFAPATALVDVPKPANPPNEGGDVLTVLAEVVLFAVVVAGEGAWAGVPKPPKEKLPFVATAGAGAPVLAAVDGAEVPNEKLVDAGVG